MTYLQLRFWCDTKPV